MADDFDLYGDLQLEEVPCAPAPSPAPVPPWRRKAQEAPVKEPAGASSALESLGEQEDSEAMQSLLRLLYATQESGLDADLDEGQGEQEEDFEEGPAPGAADDDGALLLSGADDAALPAAKRPRLGAGEDAGPAPAAQAQAPDDAFDFEADLASQATGGVLAMLSDARAGPRGLNGAARVGGADGARGGQTEYWFNPATNRWEPRDAAKEAAASMERDMRRLRQGRGSGRGARTKRSGPAPGYKTDICWQFSRGCCRKGDACFWAHGEAELRSGNQASAEALKRRVVAECVAEARADARGGVCEYPQALVVRLALRFEDKPEEMLTSMAEAGLPTGTDQRNAVKAMLRLCHPDKCSHPEAKKAVQVLGPLLGRKP